MFLFQENRMNFQPSIELSIESVVFRRFLVTSIFLDDFKTEQNCIQQQQKCPTFHTNKSLISGPTIQKENSRKP